MLRHLADNLTCRGEIKIKAAGGGNISMMEYIARLTLDFHVVLTRQILPAYEWPWLDSSLHSTPLGAF